MDVLDRILSNARSAPRRIVLSEGEDPRILQAAARAATDGIAHIILIGDPAKISTVAAEHRIKLDNIELIDPVRSEIFDEVSQTLTELRHRRGMTNEQAKRAVLDPLTFSALTVRLGYADGSVAGAIYTTADVVRNAIQLIGIQANTKLVSSFFIMLRRDPFHTTTRAMIFSDCGLVINPSAQDLAEIAVAAAGSAEQLLDEKPKIAMLSFATDGDAQHPCVKKVSQATELVRTRCPTIAIDGNIQLDAAIVPAMAKIKTARSCIDGQANVLIFPNLDAANIAYKLAERLGGATAIGPLLQGLNKPANDLSRGCNAQDIYNVIAVTTVQAQYRNLSA